LIDRTAISDGVAGPAEGTALRLGNRSEEILGIAVWFDGIPLFLSA
jgi:hypothetical protein